MPIVRVHGADTRRLSIARMPSMLLAQLNLCDVLHFGVQKALEELGQSRQVLDMHDLLPRLIGRCRLSCMHAGAQCHAWPHVAARLRPAPWLLGVIACSACSF